MSGSHNKTECNKTNCKKNVRCVHFFRVFICPILLILLISCEKKGLEVKELHITKKDGTVVVVKAEIAINEEDQAKGLMFRKRVPDGTGMLFVFKKDQIARFWMKNTPTPLSIAYIDYKGEIRDILDMEPLSLAEVVSSSYVRYALEVRQGWFKEMGIQVGDTLSPLF